MDTDSAPQADMQHQRAMDLLRDAEKHGASVVELTQYIMSLEEQNALLRKEHGEMKRLLSEIEGGEVKWPGDAARKLLSSIPSRS